MPKEYQTQRDINILALLDLCFAIAAVAIIIALIYGRPSPMHSDMPHCDKPQDTVSCPIE
jgi:hypothetical protein